MGKRKLIKLAQLILKRTLDIIVSVTALILLAPIFLVIAIAIKRDSPGGVIYKHTRIGKDKQPFKCYKFRTMICHGTDAKYLKYLQKLITSERQNSENGLPYRKMSGDPRITPVGQFLRNYYLDELPQLINILKGEMSLVGPRPHVQFEVDHYTTEQNRRLSVKPGLTGLWQVYGKSDCTFNQLIQLDLDYIDEWNLWLDIQLIWKTIVAISRGGEETQLKPTLPAATANMPFIPVTGEPWVSEITSESEK